MEVPQECVLFVCVAKGAKVLVQYVDQQHQELASAVSKSLPLLPALHRTVTCTFNDLVACYLISRRLTYCAVIREGFGKEQGFSFLERVQETFRRLMLARGFHEEHHGLEELSLERDFVPLIESMLQAATSQGWQSDQSFDDSVPLVPNKSRLDRRLSSSCMPLARSKSNKKLKASSYELREVTIISGDGEPSTGRDSPRKVTKTPWYCSLKVILTVDAVICLVVVCVWLAVCKGFSCS